MDEYSWENASFPIGTWRTAKTKNEIALAGALFEYYKKEPMRRMLSILSYHAIKELTEKADKKNLAVFLEKTKQKYRFFKDDELTNRAFPEYKETDDLIRNPKKRRDIFVKLLGEKRTKFFDPGDDADILCMYGEFIEEVGKGTYPASKKYFAPKTKDKKRITHESYRQARRKPRVSEEWTDADDRAVDFFMKGDRQKEAIGGAHKRIRAFREEKDRDVRKRQLQEYGPMMGDKPGIALFQLDEASSIKQIDRMFGLMKGADISGTTADTVFAIEALWYHFHAGTMKSGGEWTDKKIAAWMEDALRIKEVLYLLPLVTMTYQVHHTLLECAFTLSINDYIDYSVGVYTSLVPQYWKDQEYYVETGKVQKVQKGKVVLGLPEKEKKTAPWLEPEGDEFKRAVTDLKKILKDHEDTEANRYLLCYFATPQAEPKGVFVFDKKNPIERRVFNKCANIKLNMKTIGKTKEGEEVAGWASELYTEDLKRRYPSIKLVRDTVGWAVYNEGCILLAPEKIAEQKGGPDYKWTMTRAGEEEPEQKPDEPDGDRRPELRKQSDTDSRFVQDLFTKKN